MRFRVSTMSHLILRNLGKLTPKPNLVSYPIRTYFSLPVGIRNKARNEHCFCQPNTAFSTSNTSFGSEPLKPADDVDVTNVSGKKKYWRSYGFNWYNEHEDRLDANLVMFSTVTLGFVGIGFLFAYFPDVHYRDWSQREAYIEIARREALGLPHIDPNLIAPEKVNLPTDEELGDFPINI